MTRAVKVKMKVILVSSSLKKQPKHVSQNQNRRGFKLGAAKSKKHTETQAVTRNKTLTVSEKQTGK